MYRTRLFGALLMGIVRVATAQTTAIATIDAALAAHGTALATGGILNSRAEGRVTFFTFTGEAQTFDVVLLRKGTSQVQRLITQSGSEVREGTDGRAAWNAMGGFIAIPTGRPQHLIESLTTRSVEALFSYATSRLTLQDLGIKDGMKVIEAQTQDGKQTQYWIDATTSLIGRMDAITGMAKDLGGKPLATTDSYVFSDYRRVNGIATPFTIARYTSGIKIEETHWKMVVYNTTITDSDFRPNPELQY